MPLKIVWIICFLLVTNLSLKAQIKGKVIDASNDAPLSGATILTENGAINITDEKGKFSLDISTYPQTLKVSYVGYETRILTIDHATSDLIIEMNASNYLLGEVVVTAYENKQNILETPGSITMINKKELKKDNDAYIVPALNRVPGIYMHTGSYNTNRLTIRGIGSRSLFGTSKIRAYYGDIPLTTGDGETTIEDIDPNLIDRIEIIKGPASSLYGAGLGGTVLIKPKIPTSQQKFLRYQLTGGSFGYLKNALTVDLGTRKQRIALNINKIHSNGWRENNEFKRVSAGLTYKSYLSETSSLELITNYIDLFAYIPSSLDKSTYNSNPSAAASNWKNAEGYEDYTKILGGLGLNHQWNHRSYLNASIFWSHRVSDERRPFGFLEENTNALGGRARYSYDLELAPVKINLMAGIEYYSDFYNWQTLEIIDRKEGSLLTDNHEIRENINLFAKSDITFSSKTFLTLGLNVNRTNYTFDDIYSVDSVDNSGNYQFGTTISPRFAITQPVYKKINLYANISHGFSPPSLAETLTPEGDINPDIRPETGINYEIGSKGLILNDRMYYSLSLYSMQIRNLIVARRTGADQFVGVNAGKTQHNGLEMSVHFDFLNTNDPEKEFFGFLTYTLADYSFKEFVDAGNNYSGNYLTGVPSNVVNAGLSFHTLPGFYGNLNYRFVDKIPVRDDNKIFTDPYDLLNSKLGYKKLISKHFQLDVYGIINNIFDVHYASMIMVNASTFGGALPRYYYPGMPRNFYFGSEISYHF